MHHSEKEGVIIRIFAAMIGTDIQRAADLLRNGQVIGIPTETVYGLAGNALDAVAVSQIFAVKNRPSFDPLIIHTSTLDRIEGYVKEFPRPLRELAEAFMPGALTILLPRKPIIPDLVTAGMPRVAVRLPSHPLTRHLLEQLDFPLAAPSANPFGYISPTTAQHVANQLGNHIPYILDGGPCQIGVESTIVGMEEGKPTVFRQGGIAVEDMEKLIGPIGQHEHSSSNPAAPGMLGSHYAPRVTVVQDPPEDLLTRFAADRIGLLRFRQKIEGIPDNHQFVLSATGDLREAARRLFAGLRQLDSLPVDIIGVEAVPNRALGRAINDRLQRAAAPRPN